MWFQILNGYRQPAALPEKIIWAAAPQAIESLVSRNARERIVALARQFNVPVQTICYECRLAEQDAQVDFAFCLFPAFENGFVNELRRVAQSGAGGGCASEAAWAGCLSLLEHWSAPDSDLLPRIPFVCIAFDLKLDVDHEMATLPNPCLSVCIDEDFFARRLGFAPKRIQSPDKYVALVSDCYRQILRTEVPKATGALLRRCIVAEHAEPKHVSFMLSRSPPTVKLDIRVPVERVPAFLAQIGWRGPIAELGRQIRKLMPWDGAVQLNLVLEPGLTTPLEVEFLTRRGETDQRGRASILRRLVDLGLCSAQKAQTLLDVWADPVTQGDDGLTIARNWYLKVRFSGTEACDAKVYLAQMPRLQPRARPACGEAFDPRVQSKHEAI